MSNRNKAPGANLVSNLGVKSLQDQIFDKFGSNLGANLGSQNFTLCLKIFPRGLRGRSRGALKGYRKGTSRWKPLEIDFSLILGPFGEAPGV